MKFIDLQFKSLFSASVKALLEQLKKDILLEQEDIETIFQRLDKQIDALENQNQDKQQEKKLTTLRKEKAALQAIHDYLIDNSRASLPEAYAAVSKELAELPFTADDLLKIHGTLFTRLNLNSLDSPQKFDNAKLICIHSALHDKDYNFWLKLDWFVNKLSKNELEEHKQFIHNIIDVNRYFFNTCDPTRQKGNPYDLLLESYRKIISNSKFSEVNYGKHPMEWRKEFNLPSIRQEDVKVLVQLEDYLVPHYLKLLPKLCLESQELLQANPARFLKALNLWTLEKEVSAEDIIPLSTQQKRITLIENLALLTPEELIQFLNIADKAHLYEDHNVEGRHCMLAGRLNKIVNIQSDEQSILDFVRIRWATFVHDDLLKELIDQNPNFFENNVFANYKASSFYERCYNLKEKFLKEICKLSNHDHNLFYENFEKLKRLVKVIKELSPDINTFVTSLEIKDWIYLIENDTEIHKYLNFEEPNLALETIPKYVQSLARTKLLRNIDKAYNETYPPEKIGFLNKPNKADKAFKHKAGNCQDLPELMQHTTTYLKEKGSTPFTNNLLQKISFEGVKPVSVKKNNYQEILNNFLEKIQHLISAVKVAVCA